MMDCRHSWETRAYREIVEMAPKLVTPKAPYAIRQEILKNALKSPSDRIYGIGYWIEGKK